MSPVNFVILVSSSLNPPAPLLLHHSTTIPHLHTQFVAVEEHVSQLLDKIPDFVATCKQFAKDSQDINNK